MSDDISRFADRLRTYLDGEQPDRALSAMSAEPELFLRLPRVGDRAHPLVGLGAALTAEALTRCGRAREVPVFLNCLADLFAPKTRSSVRGLNLAHLMSVFPYLWNSAIVASIAMQDHEGAVAAILKAADRISDRERSDMPDDPAVSALLGHPAIAAYGPFRIDRGWLLDRQEEVLRSAALDRVRSEVYSFEELFLLNALLTEQPERAMPLIESRGLSGASPLATVGDSSSDDLEFYAVCVLATLGRFDEALNLARALIASGYYWRLRFNLDAAKNVEWSQTMRQNEWLGPLSATPAYLAFLKEEVLEEPFPEEDPTANALCALREDIWRGKKKKRCWVSKKWIVPGDEVVRVRRLVGHASDGDFDIARKDAFDQSGWAVARRQFETDTIPLALLFPAFHQHEWDTPAISVLHREIARDPATLDLGRAVTIIADHKPNKIPRGWITGWIADSLTLEYEPGVEPTVRDDGHGDAVNFTWRLLKAGFGQALFKEVAVLPQAKADKVFAMLAMFDRSDCRRAAADHFSLQDLPDMIEAAFSEKPSLETHLAMADFADRNPRWRKALVEAMASYALHLYSNYNPGADWFLQGLEHFTRARCCQLLFFLIHHPEDDEVLATMIEREWLPTSGGVDDGYRNACTFYYRTVVLNRMLHAPERLDFWLQSGLVNQYCDGRKDRETRRLVERWQKAKAAKLHLGFF